MGTRLIRLIVGVCVWFCIIQFGSDAIHSLCAQYIPASIWDHIYLCVSPVVLGLCLIVSQIGAGRIREDKPDSLMARSKMDARKWYLNRETGDYHRIIFSRHRQDGDVLYDTTTDHQRMHRRLLYIQDWTKRGHRNTYRLLSAMVFYVAGHWFAVNSCSVLFCAGSPPLEKSGISLATQGIAAILLLIFAISGYSWVMQWVKLKTSRDLALGPAPTKSSGRAEVEQQMVHGLGGFAQPDAIDAAGRGVAAPANFDDIKFKD